MPPFPSIFELVFRERMYQPKKEEIKQEIKKEPGLGQGYGGAAGGAAGGYGYGGAAGGGGGGAAKKKYPVAQGTNAWGNQVKRNFFLTQSVFCHAIVN